MKNLETQEDISVNWDANIDNPVVSIICITYNHESYIEEAIEGFLMQETDFPFEIIIHDDASTDQTANIIREYESRYPKLIRAVYQTVNQFSQGKTNAEIVYPMAKGEYIAFCEGDDYWVDRKKLQIQIDFLRNNKEYVISGHDASIIDEHGDLVKESKLPDEYKSDFDGVDLIVGSAWILTMSMVFRNVVCNRLPYEFSCVLNRDTFLTSFLGQFGKSKYHAEIQPACYRTHPGGIWSQSNASLKLDESLNTRFWLYKYYTRIGEDGYADKCLSSYNKVIVHKIKSTSMIRILFMRFLKQIYRIIKS